ncbi:hypothetical protein M501DRAFT_948134 [Patellaria atrata CBS 101060]|uniref:Uncharacterized protein n=1 Tax=Patellaria atrata CBS 101060 TaxID=1346257 RepID=A0A9P4SGI6_9PEZI|nr:hypothetical protein M501DRAFT_948134 [Patellaria atrata CBS 101060]
MASAVDTVYISTSYDVPESTIQTLLDTDAVTELVKSLLVQLENKARDYDELKSEKLRSDVELENAVRTGDARARMLRSSVEKSMKEVEILKKKLDEEGATKQPSRSLSCQLSHMYAFRKYTCCVRDRIARAQVIYIPLNI